MWLVPRMSVHFVFLLLVVHRHKKNPAIAGLLIERWGNSVRRKLTYLVGAILKF